MKNYAIILAAGSGKRFQSDLPKQFTKIGGKTLLEYSIEAFEFNNLIDHIVLVINSKYRDNASSIINNNGYKKVLSIIEGGVERKDSSYNGISSILDHEANVLIHDCARPFVSQEIITNCVKALDIFDAVTTAIPCTDSIIEVENGKIVSMPKREKFNRVQTPQGFKLSLIKKAHELSIGDNSFTDDCGLVLKHNLSEVHIVEGTENNNKITYSHDIVNYVKLMSD